MTLADILAQSTQPDLALNPQEEALYQRHLQNLLGPGGVTNFNGSRSTLRQMSVDADGRTFNIPTVWDGRILPPDDALARARETGMDTFPSYASPTEAEARYDQMHKLMEQDVTRAKSLPLPMGAW